MSSKTTTSLTIDSKVIDAYRDQHPEGNLSAFVEETLRKEIGDSLSLEDIETKMNESEGEAEYWREKYFDMAHSLAIEKKLEHQDEVGKAKAKEEEYQDRVSGWIESNKNIKEFNDWMELLKINPNEAVSSKKLMEIGDIVRKQGGRLGIKQFEQIARFIMKNQKD